MRWRPKQSRVNEEGVPAAEEWSAKADSAPTLPVLVEEQCLLVVHYFSPPPTTQTSSRERHFHLQSWVLSHD